MSHRSVSILIALALGGIVAYGVCRIPVQVSDSVGNMLQVQHVSLQEVRSGWFETRAYLRPLMWAQIKIVLDVGAGHEQLAFKAVHVAQTLLLTILFMRLVPVGTRIDLAAAIVGLLVLFGIHTFDGMVREAFPVNHFLVIALCTLAATNLAVGTPRWWKDLAAIALFSFAILTIESGVLVLVALVAGRLVGFKGVSWTGVTGTMLAFVGYLVLRFAVLEVGSPGLDERPSGFGFERLEPSELVARFGSNPLPLYAYNVVCALVSVLLAEPRGGVWYAVRTLADGGSLPSWLTINLAASASATAVVMYVFLRSIRRWRSGEAQFRDRVVLVALAVLLANAATSFGYLKDVVMSTGGVFFALAVCAGTASLLEAARSGPKPWLGMLAVAIIASLWFIRAAALPYRLELQSARVQAEWTDVYGRLDPHRVELAAADAQALVARLRHYALRSRPTPIEWTGWHVILDLN